MEFKLEIPAIRGEIIPLFAVANAFALRDATAGGTPYHEPTFNGRLTGYIHALLEEVRSGRLEVCDSYGGPITVDPQIEATAHFGYGKRYVNEPDWETLRRETPPVGNGAWNFSHINFGPKEIDKSRPRILWCSKLAMLNKWAGVRGDSFVISHESVGWFDERGYVAPINHDTGGPKHPPMPPISKLNPPTAEATTSIWMNSAKAIGKDIASLHRNLSLEQLSKRVHEEMLKRERSGIVGMTGRGGKVPKAETIRRKALYRINLNLNT